MPDEASLEDRLRDLLSDPRWSLRPWPDALQRVQRTARRQRIAGVSVAACTGVVAVAACVVPLAVLGVARGTPGPGIHPPTPSAAQASPVTREMPMVVGLQLATAESIIRAALANPHINVMRVEYTPVPPGMIYSQNPRAGTVVLAQTPQAGTHVAPGSQITLQVAPITLVGP